LKFIVYCGDEDDGGGDDNVAKAAAAAGTTTVIVVTIIIRIAHAGASSRLPVRPHGTTRLPLDRFSLNFTFEFISKISRKFSFY
jgi:hypothetical protein